MERVHLQGAVLVGKTLRSSPMLIPTRAKAETDERKDWCVVAVGACCVYADPRGDHDRCRSDSRIFDDVLRIWSALDVLVGAIGGAVVTYFFSSRATEAERRTTEAVRATVAAERRTAAAMEKRFEEL